MLLKRLFFAIVITVFVSKSFSQVNLQSGSATFSLPIFNWKDDKSRLYTSVALDYNSGNGLKVNDVASSIGQGWNLVTGGVITRMQVGEPDDQQAYESSASSSDRTKFPNGLLYGGIPISNGCPAALLRYPIYSSRNQIYAQHNAVSEDKQADYFSFQFNGKVGLFILDTIGVCQSLGDTKMKITFQTSNMRSQGKRTTITSFQIQDVDGLIYKFTQHGLTKVLRTEYCDQSLQNEQKQPKEFKGGKVYYQKGFDKGPTGGSWVNTELAYPWIVSGWYLTEIEDALTHKKVLLTYDVMDVVQNAGADIIYDKEQDYTTILNKVSVTKTPELKTITMPEGHSVTINYGNNRIDMNGARVISSIDVKYQTRYVSRHVLNTTYFILNRYGTPTTAYQKSVARLCLKSVKKIGPDLKDDMVPYVFDYYIGSSAADDFVPPPFFYAKDIWGFYNGNESKAFNGTDIALNTSTNLLINDNLKGLCFLRNSTTGIVYNPKSGYAKNGLLRQIIYPTGGALSYEYEQNYGKPGGGSERTVGGVHVSKTLSTDGGYSNGCATPITTNYNYVESSGTASSLWGVEIPLTSIETSSYYDPEKKKYKFPASCDYKYKYPGILSQNQSIGLSDWQKFMQVFSVVADIVSVVSLVLDVITYIAAGTGIVGIIIAVIIMIGTAIWSCTKSMSRSRTHLVYYNFDLSGFGSLPSQFRRVEVVEGSGTMGKTVTEFTSSNDYAIWYPDNPSLAARQRYAPWAYGLPKYITHYDANGYMVKQTFNKYDWDYARRELLCDNNILTSVETDLGKSRGDDNVLVSASAPCRQSLKCFVKRVSSQRNVDWENPSFYNANYYPNSTSEVLVQFYSFYTGRVLLDTTFERVYRPSSTQYLETITAYSYRNDYNYEPYLVSTIHSNGDRVDKTIKYQGDYTGTIMTALTNANMVSTSVSENQYINKVSGTSGFLYEAVTEFSQLSNGDIRPSRIIEQKFDKPSSMTLYAGPGSSTTNYKEVQTTYYDGTYGLITGAKDEANRTIRNLWGYNNKFVVASIKNVNVTTDKFGYTSFEDGFFGGWTVSGTSYNTAQAITGGTSFNVSSSATLSFALNIAKIYTLSFWSTSGTVTVTGGSLLKSGPGLNGFTYYEYTVPASTATVSIAGSGTIDELRLYPAAARMNSTTYDPILGKTDECDENNRITYYEYDNLGRLRMIKDEKKNIVKMYEYNSISSAKQNGCPTTYYNKIISEIFTKNSCGAGYQGGDVTFTIAANAYSSTISQEDADLKAEVNLLTNGQAYANTNGICKQIYYNTAQSLTVVSEGCAVGYKGGNYTYTVPANRYSSLISVADANDKALMDIDANAYAFANATPVCVVSTDADWEEVENNKYCLTVGGALPAHEFMLFKDVNPNSSTYNQTQWIDLGASDNCPANTYFNAQRTQAFTRNNCGAGYTGSTVNYTVPPGKYSSTASQAAADQLAINDANANGQNYANANGTCSLTTIPVTVKNNGSSGTITGAAQFTNSSNQTFSGSFGGPQNSTVVNLLPGTYTLKIALSPGSTVPVLIDVNGTQQVEVSTTGAPVTIGSVNISSGFYVYGYATYFSNTAQSGTFTRNNCPAGQTGSNVTYTVAANTYYSGISQADANSKALAVVNANGQNYANTNGTCSSSTPTNCTFTWASGITPVGASSVIATGSTVNFVLRFMSPTNGYSGGTICTIDGTCRPAANRTVNVTDGSNVWAVTVTPTGTTIINFLSGTPPASSALITLSNSYTK